MRITVLTLFKEQFDSFLNTSIISRILEKELCEVRVVDIRDYSKDKHRHVDDTPYGGGAGMLMRVDILADAIRANRNDDTYILLTSPKAKPYEEKDAYRLLEKEDLMIVCGHYEGVDDRISDFIDENISIGRLGIFIHITAGFGDVGFSGYWTLEIFCIKPIIIYPNVEIAQLYYHTIDGDYEEYNSGKYQNNTDIQPSMLYKDFLK